MRRVTVNILRCPRCRRGALHPEADTAEILFGPLRCSTCQGAFPVAEGVADLLEDLSSSPAVQRGLERPWVARSYERYLRPALQLALARRRLDRDSEYLLYRSMLGTPEGPVLDLAAGTGLFARRLAREEGFPPVIALDLSRPMIEEAVAQSREAGVMVDFVRARIPSLPFLDHSLGGVLQSGSLHLIEDLPHLFSELARVLRPGARYVASTYLPPSRPVRLAQRRAGLFPRTEAQLREALSSAGLVKFERMVLAPFILVKAEKPMLRLAT